MNLNPDSRFYRWVVNPIIKQLKQGIAPERIAWAISLGVVLGIFPIMGTTSIVCIIAGYFLKLNQAILHLFKSLSCPLHLAMILVYIRLGQMLNGVPLIKFSIPQLLVQFKDNPLKFFRDFGMAAVYGVEVWAISAIFLIPILYFVSLPLLKKLLAKLASDRTR